LRRDASAVQNRPVDGYIGRFEIATWNVLLAFLGGYGLGAVVIYADFHWWSDAHRDFAGSGPFFLWQGLMCTQTGLWALVLAWILPSVLRLRHEYRVENRGEVLGSTAVIFALILLVVVIPPFTNPLPTYLPGHVAKVIALTLIGSVVGLIAAWGVWYVHGGLKRLGSEARPTGATLQTFLKLDAELHRFLGTLGAILGLLILGTGAQRRTVLAYEPKARYPYENVLVYGLIFSILVAAVYLPTFLALKAAAERLRDAFFPVVSRSRPNGRSGRQSERGSSRCFRSTSGLLHASGPAQRS
jgi:hypothetical protein